MKNLLVAIFLCIGFLIACNEQEVITPDTTIAEENTTATPTYNAGRSNTTIANLSITGIVAETQQPINANLDFQSSDAYNGVLDYGSNHLYHVNVTGADQDNAIEMIRQLDATTYQITTVDGNIYLLDNVTIQNGSISGWINISSTSETIQSQFKILSSGIDPSLDLNYLSNNGRIPIPVIVGIIGTVVTVVSCARERAIAREACHMSFNSRMASCGCNCTMDYSAGLCGGDCAVDCHY